MADAWRREWLPTLVFLPGEFHGQRNLEGYSLWCCKELDTTEKLTLTRKDRMAREGDAKELLSWETSDKKLELFYLFNHPFRGAKSN